MIGYVLLIGLLGLITLGACVLIAAYVSFTLVPMIWGDAPLVGTQRKRLTRMLQLAELTTQDRVIDLGSGDGRLVFGATRAGVKQAVGYEIHPLLVWRSRLFANLFRLPNAHFVRRSFWGVTFTDVDVVFVYQLPRAMIRLAKKFAEELPPGARIISNTFELPGWEPIHTEEGIWVYQKERRAK